MRAAADEFFQVTGRGGGPTAAARKARRPAAPCAATTLTWLAQPRTAGRWTERECGADRSLPEVHFGELGPAEATGRRISAYRSGAPAARPPSRHADSARVC